MCPFCRNLGMALSQFVPQAGGRVAVYFKNFPLDKACNERLPGSTHPGACNLALGAICARYQGKFDAYHDRVFSTELRNPQAADVVRLAGEAGLNAAAIQGCLDDPKAKADLAADIAEGNRLGVNSTPTVYINGKKLPRINDFVAVVDKEARKKGFAAESHHDRGAAARSGSGSALGGAVAWRLTRGPRRLASHPRHEARRLAPTRPSPRRPAAPRRAAEPGPERGARPGRGPRRPRARACRGRRATSGATCRRPGAARRSPATRPRSAWRASPPSPEADIYSAGAIAWEVLVGRPCGELPAPLSGRRARPAARARERGHGVPRALAAVAPEGPHLPRPARGRAAEGRATGDGCRRPTRPRVPAPRSARRDAHAARRGRPAATGPS